ncbi:MAG: PaaI family thioesterase [Candidatus Hydrogenedentes bacterium]|nr:PaaI family thioesterase [Candidatus Hydrogenedentota bacterium]
MKLDMQNVNDILADYFAGLVGMTVSLVEPGHSICHLDITPRHLNAGGVLHGGAQYTLADTSMALAVLAGLEDGLDCATLEVKRTYIKAVSSGSVTCETRVVGKGNRIAFLESEVRSDGNLIAKASGTFYILRRKP